MYPPVIQILPNVGPLPLFPPMHKNLALEQQILWLLFIFLYIFYITFISFLKLFSGNSIPGKVVLT